MSKNSLAVQYAVQRKNKKKPLVRAGSEKPTADRDQYAEGGEVRAGSEKPTADSGQTHECNSMCSENAHYDSKGGLIRAGSSRPSADSDQRGQNPASPSTGGTLVRAGSQRPSADFSNQTNQPSRRAAPPGMSVRAASSRPTSDSDQMGSTRMLAEGGDVEGEDTSTHMGTLAEAIAKRLAAHMMAEGGMAHDDGLDENSEEHGNYEDDLSYEALGKEQYDDDQLSDQPEDSNEDGDEDEKRSEDQEDDSIISKIRARNKKKA